MMKSNNGSLAPHLVTCDRREAGNSHLSGTLDTTNCTKALYCVGCSLVVMISLLVCFVWLLRLNIDSD